MHKLLNGLSLFSNVGIGETYLKNIGINIKVANELLSSRVAIYKELHPDTEMICGDITDSNVFNKIIECSKKNNINLIIATPPCQGMSIAGQMNPDDPRNSLIIKAMETFNLLQPDYMLIENVPQMLKTSILVNGQAINIKDYLQSIADKHNYYIKFDILNAADYGTAQNRKRTIVRIYKKDLDWPDAIKQPYITVKDKIGDLPSLESGESSDIPYHYSKVHNENHVLWMKHTPTSKTAFDNPVHYPQKDGRRIKGFSTTYKRISWDKPAPTITMANGSISSQNNVHPGRLLPDGTYSDARVLTHLELFRLMGLPDNWADNLNLKDSLLRQVIGEAVPPIMMKSIFEPIFNNNPSL